MNPRRLTLCIVLIALACLGFRAWQNSHGRLGGEISLAKALWLATALVHFYLIPATLAMDARFSTRDRRVYRIFLVGFVLRAAIELPVMVFTNGWRCGYGISHNFLMLALLWLVGGGGMYHWLLSLVLLAESLNAWLFAQAADPRTGTYFAGDSSAFALINRVTWVELAVLTPLLIAWLARELRQDSGTPVGSSMKPRK